jgi:toxin FitB
MSSYPFQKRVNFLAQRSFNVYLLDINVLSELRKIAAGKADKKVTKWANSVDAAELYLSTITIQEIEIGIVLLERKDLAQANVFRRWLEEQVLPSFEKRILSVDVSVARRSARFYIPDPKPIRDSLIAATSVVHAMVMVTRNVADFKLLGVNVLNPWK